MGRLIQYLNNGSFSSLLFVSVDAFDTFQTSVWIASSFVYVPRESRDIKFESAQSVNRALSLYT